ncbi:hypothetical protein PRK78_001278 [Emydomyces testavorans]|uniref:Uncharacterized protein n=1 Tax=Emydomyces testavorans TaxID=2070801 RepID=A0AAF0DCM6_9EURO|nr:hypothetical protein PRK78_001278 [Emydomyces testavorans]
MAIPLELMSNRSSDDDACRQRGEENESVKDIEEGYDLSGSILTPRYVEPACGYDLAVASGMRTLSDDTINYRTCNWLQVLEVDAHKMK